MQRRTPLRNLVCAAGIRWTPLRMLLPFFACFASSSRTSRSLCSLLRVLREPPRAPRSPYYPLLAGELGHRQHGVVAAKAHRIGERDPQRHLTAGVGHVVEVAFGVGML